METETNKVNFYDLVKDKDGRCKLHKRKLVCLDNVYILNREQAVEVIRAVIDLWRLTEEYVWMLSLNADGRLTGIFEVSHGHLLGTVINIRGIITRALLINASDIIVTHNHISGRCVPSKMDLQVNESLKSAAILMEIPLKDNLIVSENNYYSMLKNDESIETNSSLERKHQ